MTEIIVTVLAILLAIFPESHFLLSNYQSFSFPGEIAITEIVIEAAKNNDVAAIEGLLSQRTKETVDDIPAKIEEMISLIDGEITEYKRGGASFSDYSDGYNSVHETSWNVEFKTDTGKKYHFDIYWNKVDTSNPDKVGMELMTLCDITVDKTLIRVRSLDNSGDKDVDLFGNAESWYEKAGVEYPRPITKLPEECYFHAGTGKAAAK